MTLKKYFGRNPVSQYDINGHRLSNAFKKFLDFVLFDGRLELSEKTISLRESAAYFV